MTSDAQIKLNMDRMYRWTRHIYDASRKYYLLGRDHLIEHISPQEGEHVCEVGCGTARNLRKLAKRYPSAHFYGLDASDEMLKTAKTAMIKAGVCERVQLKQAYAQNFIPQTLFELERPLDKIVFSYALSIIPPWRESIDHALELLETGKEIHIIDFGGQEKLPPLFRRFLFWWLAMFHVYHKPEILDYLKRLELEKCGTLEVTHLYKNYAYYAVFRKS